MKQLDQETFDYVTNVLSLLIERLPDDIRLSYAKDVMETLHSLPKLTAPETETPEDEPSWITDGSGPPRETPEVCEWEFGPPVYGRYRYRCSCHDYSDSADNWDKIWPEHMKPICDNCHRPITIKPGD